MTLYLSRLQLDPRSSQVRAELRNPYEMHRTLSKAFAPSTLPEADAKQRLADARMLFRVDVDRGPSSLVALVQSRVPPEWSALTVAPGYFAAALESRAFEPTFRSGQRLGFRLRANPTVKRGGKRRGLYHEPEQVSWLGRKGETSGFALERAMLTVEHRGLRMARRGSEMMHLAVRFDGVLRVGDPERFAAALATGVGSAKGLGFGLLSIAPARE